LKIKGSGPLKDCVLEFNGHDHKISLVQSKATAERIEVKLAEIDLAGSLGIRPMNHDADQEDAILIKHHGKFQILLGRDSVIDGFSSLPVVAIKARLISSVALKAARVVKEQPAPPAAAPFNPPRFTDNRAPGAANRYPPRYGDRSTAPRDSDYGNRPRESTSGRDAWNRPYNSNPRYGSANAGPAPERTRTYDHIRNDAARSAASYPPSGNRQTYGKPHKKTYP
jgi:hypothetical protein